MSQIEIPLLRESTAFADRLLAAARCFGEPRYHFHRRVNWSHRFSERFYAREADCFLQSSHAYLAGNASLPPYLPDVYAHRLRFKEVLGVIVKVLAHWAFGLIGRGAARRLAASGLKIYRKCYVDDIELVFDPIESSMFRAVYPFPLSVRRQLRYLQALRRKGIPFVFAGNPYLGSDLLRLVWRRDVRSMMRLESRANILHAVKVAALGVSTVQLSDEFNLGSLDFARALARLRVRVVNSAHGVGKYLPVHAYQEFFVLTCKQQDYYHAVVECRYCLRSLNDVSAAGYGSAPRGNGGIEALPVRLAYLSQTFPGLNHIVGVNEDRIISRLAAEFSDNPDVQLYFKSHPTHGERPPPPGFRSLNNLEQVNGQPGTIFVSQFSTCQIDPSFKGRKVLVRGPLIHPEISFDDSEQIVTVDELVNLVREALLARSFRPACWSESQCA